MLSAPLAIRSLHQTLHEMAEAIERDFEDLLSHAKLERRFSREGGLVVISGSPFSWEPLPSSGRLAQLRVRERYARFSATLRVLLAPEARTTRETFATLDRQILSVIDQETSPWETVEQVREAIHGSIRSQLNLVYSLGSAGESRLIVVPDTNALLWNPALEDWAWPGVNAFSIALTPIVLQELDRLKSEHRVEAVKEKAGRLIRQIKEYRRRGRLTEGVPLRTGVSSIFAVALEPNMGASLPWLNPESADDRLLATVVEIARRDVMVPVGLVTLDINLQNKAELADLSFLEPPSSPPT